MIRIGSRGSQLALWQANAVAVALGRLGHQTAIEVIHTTGDRMQHVPYQAAGGKGIFIREIEEALAEGRIDAAVHSLKDLPVELSPQFVLAAIPERADARDALVSPRFDSLAALRPQAVVGTGSLRRQAQLRGLRPDLKFTEFRGNVDTRLRKLEKGAADAIVLAAAGLDRLEKSEWIRYRFPPLEVCPAPGQGAMAVECRAVPAKTVSAAELDEDEIRFIVAALDDVDTHLAVIAERALLLALGGGCATPIGAYASFGSGSAAGELHLVAAVAAPDGGRILREEGTGRVDTSADAIAVGVKVAEKLRSQGALDLLRQAEG